MNFNINISKERYEKFYLENKGHFMQSYAWGQSNIKGRGQNPHYVGLEQNGNILCEALLLEKKGPMGLSYFYSPRGYIIDYNNKQLLKQFTDNLKNFLKEHHGIYLKVDPEIEYQEIDEAGNCIENENNNYELFNTMLNLGYTHTGFVKNFENNQPRYTFRIDLNNDLPTLEKNIHKSVMKKIKKTYEYEMEFRESNDVKTFYQLITKTSEKDNFQAYTYEYYKNAYEILGKDNIYKLFELVINPKEIYMKTKSKLEIIEEQLNDINIKQNIKKQLEESKNRIIKEQNIIYPYKDQEQLIICSQMCAMTSDTMWTLYIGNDEIGKELYAVNRMYLEIIKYAKETNHKYLDLFGTTGDVYHAHGNLAGIHNFKKNFGGKYIEFIGEFDLINNKFLYKILPIFLKIYRKLIKIRRKK